MSGDTQTQETVGWRPEPGEVLSGEVTNVSRGWSDWQSAYYPLVTVRETGTNRMVDVHGFHHTLERRLMETRPKIGDKLEITYIGEQRTKDDKRTVHVYNVTVPGATGQEVWDSLDRQGTSPAVRGSAMDDTP